MTRGERRAEGPRDPQRRPVPHLVLLNGLPGVGKSTVARAWAERHPGTLNLDIDLVRPLINGDVRDTAEPARALGLAMAVAHLRSGHAVVVPQLVARRDQVARFAAAGEAAGARMVHVLLEAPAEVVAERIVAEAAPHRRDLEPAVLARYAEGLGEVARRAGVHRLVSTDLAGTVERLELLVRPLR